MKRFLPLPALVAAAIGLGSAAAAADADVVVLNNCDTLNGTIGLITPSEIEFTSPAFGTIKIPTYNVQKYTFDRPVTIDPRGVKPFQATGVTGDAQGIRAGESGPRYEYKQIRSVNPPKEEWKGALLANLSLARGNTNKFVVGAEAKAQLRRDNDDHNDRTTFGVHYNYGTSGRGEESVTDTDNWAALGKYDRFWTDRLYGYVTAKLEHDRIADLYYRASPGVGVGYQWFENPKVNFYTESGVTYIHESFDPQGTEDEVALRLAYRYENKLNDRVTLFHTLEFLPAFHDPADYILNTDLGVKATLTGNFFAQFKVLYKRDSVPAEDALRNDLLYTVGVGWSF